MIHELKIIPKWFKEIKSGAKKFECRVNDRNYNVGDVLILKEWTGKFTGQSIRVCVTSMLIDEQFTRKNMVIMSIEVIKISVKPSVDDEEKAKQRMKFLGQCWSEYKWNENLMPLDIAEKFKLLQKEQQEFEAMYF